MTNAGISSKNTVSEAIRLRLAAEHEDGYAEFSSKLIPNIARQSILGVRLPKLRIFAKELLKRPESKAFFYDLPHTYLEENTLHALMLNSESELESSIELLKAFLPYVDNWATCDALRPAAVKAHFKAALPFIYECIESEHSYSVRFGIEMLMCYGLGENFLPVFHALTAKIQSEHYYVNMMRAWYFATALAVRYEETLPYLTENRIDTWTHNRSIQKALESFRIADEQKLFLKTLRILKQAMAKKTAQKSAVLVSAAVIRREEKVLICQRPPHKARQGQWEFPGGKLESGESAEEALIRECREELNVTLRITRRLTTLTHTYPDLTVRLFVFEAVVDEGKPEPLEHSKIEFVFQYELKNYDICQADREIAALLVQS